MSAKPFTVPASPLPRFSYGPSRTTYALPGRVALAALVLLLPLAGLFFWTVKNMYLRWVGAIGYYSHGPWIPLISLVTASLLIRHRGLPMHSTRRSRVLGIGLIVLALLVHLVCMYARVTFVSGFMIPVILLGIVLHLGGFPMAQRLWFPIVFLVFMVPLPDYTIGAVNFRLKMLAANLSTHLVNFLGVPAINEGSVITLAGGKSLTVEAACSGLKSLISLLAFSTLFTYACRLRGYKRALLFLSAVPIAVAANAVRILILTLTAHYANVALATPGGWVHDAMGFIVFVVAFCLMFLEEEVLDLLPGRKPGESGATPKGVAA